MSECESVVGGDVKVNTQGSGEYGNPSVTLRNVSASRVHPGNTSRAGLMKDDQGNVIGEYLEHRYEATATIEAESPDETEAHLMAKDCKNRLAKYHEYSRAFHEDCNAFNTTSIEDAGLAVSPPDPTHKQAFTVLIDYTEVIENTDTSLIGETIEEIHSDIDNN